MNQLSKIDQVIKKAASAALKPSNVIRVFSSPTADSYGDDAIDVTIVIADDTVETVSDRDVGQAIVQIGRNLQMIGDHRLPIVTFATEAELAAEDDAEG